MYACLIDSDVELCVRCWGYAATETRICRSPITSIPILVPSYQITRPCLHDRGRLKRVAVFQHELIDRGPCSFTALDIVVQIAASQISYLTRLRQALDFHPVCLVPSSLVSGRHVSLHATVISRGGANKDASLAST
jgi:hypothetical protein